MNYGSKSEVYSELGDSGATMADIRARIGVMISGSSSKNQVDVTYATPVCQWLLERIEGNGLPNVHLNVVH